MKISIITINYNNAEGLQRTLASVDGQSCHDFEMVIVDGGSQDASRAVIEEYVKNHSDVIWVSEPDKGIYNAMNKGTRMSSGDYCIFMNSGDCFYQANSLKECVPHLDGRYDIVSGAVKTDQFLHHSPLEKELSMTYFIKDSMNHQSTFIKRQLLLDFPYNEKRKIVADSEFFFQTLILNNSTYLQISTCVSYCEAAGESGNLDASLAERMKAIKNLLPSRMAYDVDFIQKFHNPIVMKIGDMLYIPLLRNMYLKYNQIKKRLAK